MGHDPLSPIAPARLKTVLLPVGKIKRSRFLRFVERLEAETVVRLGDVSPDGRPNRNMFSPLAFSAGKILFDLSISDVSQAHISLSPFEHFREPIAIVGIADGGGRTTSSNGVPADSDFPNGVEHNALPQPGDDMDEIVASLAILKELHPQALVHQVFMFDSTVKATSLESIVTIPPLEESNTTTLKTIMCSLTSLILGEFTEYAKYIQGLSTLESPRPGSEDLYDQPPAMTRTTSFKSSSPQPGIGPGSHGLGLKRSTSTEDRVMHRMSMPVQVSPKPGETSRQISGASGKFVATRIPGSSSTFEDIQRTSSPSNRASGVSTPLSEGNSTEHSRERVPVQGFGSTSATEKTRNRNKGRAGMVIGSLYLQTGRWPDALKQLVESATIARANSDYLWQAKSLENIIVTVLMMGWAGMDFQIPTVCYPSVADRLSISASKSSPLVNSTSPDGATQIEAANRLVALQNLANLLPELLNHILNLYTRAANITEEALPQLAFSETVIRFSKLLSSCHLRDGYIDDPLLNHIVMNEPLKQPDKNGRPRGGAYLRKNEIAARLFRALPTSTENALPSRDLSPILVAMASIVSSLGLERKKAFILRELLSSLVPALVHARKIGAAEMGIHPAAGLSAIDAGLALKSLDPKSANLQKGLGTFMRSIGDVYGIVGLDTLRSDEPEVNGATRDHDNIEMQWDSNEAIMIRAIRNNRLRNFGMLVLKIDLLVACVNFCEALPDFQGVLQFTIELLQTISPGTPLPPDGKGMQFLPRDEQMRLISNIKRTVGAGNKLGLKNLEAEYWDDFLVRGVEILEHSQQKKLIPHSKTELQVAEAIQDTSKKNPFIYNPFAKPASAGTAEQILVSGEHAMFKVDLQNPFEFELEIEKLILETEGVLFESAPHNLVIAPYCMHTVDVTGLAKESGALRITGCVVKVKDCRERRFPIFRDAWKPKPDIKSKVNGLAARNSNVERPLSTSSEGSQEKTSLSGKLPEAETLSATVIDSQPSLIVKSASLPQSAVMLLEGETKTFSITLQNTSLTTAVDFVLFTFRDSTTSKLQSAMSNKDIPPAELYELELQLSKQPLTWKRDDGETDTFIEAGQSSTLTIEIFGIPGLTEATIQIDYGHLGVPKSDIRDKFYTRQILIPITVTVNASVEMVKWDILPFTGDFAWLNQRKQQHLSNGSIPTPNDPSPRSRAISRSSRQDSDRRDENNQFQSLLDRLGLRSHGDDHCLLLLDLRNAWPSPLSISIQVRDATSLAQSPSGSDPWRRAYTVHEILQPGHVSRLVLLIPRIFLPNLHAPIPVLNPATQRQYVVSATKIPADQELANRESFWFRAELLKHIRGSWSEASASTSREGAIELRGIRLNPRMLDAMRVEDVDISFHLSSSSATFNPNDDPVHQTARSSFTVPTHTFLTLTSSIRNRSSYPIHPLLRLQPSLRNQPQPLALDLSKRVVWTGMLQRALPILGPGETVEAKLGLCVMCRGEFEIGGSVEEVRVLKAEGRDGMDALALRERERGRKIWHAREGCTVVARDGDDVFEDR